MKIFYHPKYNIGLFGLESLHPFDSKKYGRAYKLLKQELIREDDGELFVTVDREVSDEELRLVHTPEYLESLKQSATIARAVEIPPVNMVPSWLARRQLLRPMRFATRGTILAAKAALEHSCAVNLSGGYHHAKPGSGEGFCVFADVAIAIKDLRAKELIAKDAKVLYIDLDAHLGNGVAYAVHDDPSIKLFDMYNGRIYPVFDTYAVNRLDVDIPLEPGCSGMEYLDILSSNLAPFLEEHSDAAIVVYNAGTDVFSGDSLGGLGLSAFEILERDIRVLEQVQSHNLPLLVVPSGGYSKESYKMLASLVTAYQSVLMGFDAE